MIRRILILIMCVAFGVGAEIQGQAPTEHGIPKKEMITKETASEKKIKKILFIGDSMTGWLSERLNAYGKLNGFEVSTVVWDGSTIKKWADSPAFPALIEKMDPDAVFVSLGMNELFESNPERQLKQPVEEIIRTIGDRRLVWLGPPSWPGQTRGGVLNNWLAGKLGPKAYFNSFNLDLPRQSSKNPHPTRDGITRWADGLVDWIQKENILPLDLDKHPSESQMSRGDVFIYKRINETL